MESPGPLRAVRSWEEAIPERGSERDVHEAMLLTVGELGYAKATVREVARRAGIGEDRLQRRFGGKEACFAAAYAEAAEVLRDELFAACEEAAGWRAGFEAALAALLRFVAEQPLAARALLIEVKAARGEAWAHHQRAVGHLTEVLDSARNQPGARPKSSPMTAGFVAGAIEESLCIEIAAGRAAEVERLLPDLTRLAFLQLFGEDSADIATERQA
jgi:AcrR family transcriptional regulator